jgi:hypothetical protein
MIPPNTPWSYPATFQTDTLIQNPFSLTKQSHCRCASKLYCQISNGWPKNHQCTRTDTQKLSAVPVKPKYGFLPGPVVTEGPSLALPITRLQSWSMIDPQSKCWLYDGLEVNVVKPGKGVFTSSFHLLQREPLYSCTKMKSLRVWNRK